MTAASIDVGHLEPVVAAHLGAGHTVEGLRRLSGGASRETWSFEAVAPDGARLPLVLRRDPPGGAPMGTPVDEYALIDAAGRAGVPVAPLRFRLDPADELGVGFATDFVAGETLGRRIVQGPPEMLQQKFAVPNWKKFLTRSFSAAKKPKPKRSAFAHAPVATRECNRLPSTSKN